MAFSWEEWTAFTQCGPPHDRSSGKACTTCAQTVHATQRQAP